MLGPDEPVIPTELLTAFERGELIVMVGPELARQAGLPDRQRLAVELLSEAESVGLADAPTLHTWIATGRIEDSLEVLEQRLGPRFHRVTERLFTDRPHAPPMLARAVAALADRLRAVYTTGVDRLLERAFADQWPSIVTPQPDVARRTKLIFKLCGTLEFRDTWVLTRAALEREFGERSLRRQLLVTAYRAHCLLWVAFAPDDELTARLLSAVDLSTGTTSLPSHFVVFNHCDLDQRMLFERRGLHVITGDPVEVLQTLGQSLNLDAARPRPPLPACPYPGLFSFDDSLAAVFHGRRAEISQAASQLGGPPQRHCRWLAIDGSSGVGKSSFVHAGLVPALRRGFAEGTPTQWLVVSMRPGQRPMHALVQEMTATILGDLLNSSADFDSATITDELSTMVLENLSPNTGLLLIVDQFEELVTLSRADERADFSSSLGTLLDQQLIYLVTTIRSDFVAALASTEPAFARRLNEQAARYTLAPISRLGLRMAIAEPAAQFGVSFEPELVERIATDAEQHLGVRHDEQGIVRTDDSALPLVAHVLRTLWDIRASESSVISFADYEALGGVSGALSRSADELFLQIGRKQLRATKALLLGLTSLDDGRLVRRTLARSEALALAGGGSDGERLLSLLSGVGGPRLVVVRGHGPEAVVDLVHEALLREWNTLRGWIAANRAQLERDEALARRAVAWSGQGRPWRSLPRGPERRELLRGRAHGSDATTQREYQKAMRRFGWFLGASWTGFVGGLGLAAVMLVSHEQRRREDLNRIADALVTKTNELDDRTREVDEISVRMTQKEEDAQHAGIRAKIKKDHVEHRCREALTETLRLLPEDDSNELRELLAQLVQCKMLVGPLADFEHDKSRLVTAMAISPSDDEAWDEAWVGYENGDLVRWELGTHTLHRALGLRGAIEHIRMTDMGSTIAISSSSTTALRDAHGQARGEPIPGADPALSPDGRYVANHFGDHKLNLHAAATGEHLWTREFAGRIDVIEFSSDSSQIAFTSNRADGNELIIASTATGEPIYEFPASGFVRDLEFVGDAQLLALAEDRLTRLLDIEHGEDLAEPLQVAVKSTTLRFVTGAPSGSRVLTLMEDDAAALVPVADRELKAGETFEIDPHVRPCFSADGAWLVTVDGHAGMGVRDAESGQELARLDSSGVSALACATNGFASDSDNGKVTHWGVDTRTHWSGPRASAQIRTLAFDPSNPRMLLYGGADAKLQAWTIGATEAEHVWPLNGWAMALAFTDAQSRTLTLSDQGTLYTGHADAVTEIGSLPCTSRLAAIDVDGNGVLVECDDQLVLWNTTTRAVQAQLTVKDTTSLALSMGGRTLAVGRSNGEFEVMQITDTGVTREAWIGHHAGAVTSLAFDASGTRLVSGGNDDAVRLWSPGKSHEPVYEQTIGVHNVESVTISRTGTYFAAGDDKGGAIEIWNQTGQRVARFDDGCGGHAVMVLQFSPDEQLLAAGCKDGSVGVWPIGEQAQIEFACDRLAHTSSELLEQCQPQPN